MSGKFITFEGLDACGKSLQLKILARRLEESGHAVLVLREPGSTSLSEGIRTILLRPGDHSINPQAEFLLYSAARAQLVQEKIRPALHAGQIVLCDRYYDSSSAYQGYGRGLDLNAVQFVNTFATHGIAPDVTLLLDIDVETMKERQRRAGVSLDRMEAENDGFFEKVRRGYLALAQQYPERICVIDGRVGVEEIANAIWDLTGKIIQGG